MLPEYVSIKHKQILLIQSLPAVEFGLQHSIAKHVEMTCIIQLNATYLAS